MNKSLKEITEYIKQNPDCIIEYWDKNKFIIYKKSDKKKIAKTGDGGDYDVNDDGEDYIPNIANLFLYCAKKGIDISKIILRSC